MQFAIGLPHVQLQFAVGLSFYVAVGLPHVHVAVGLPHVHMAIGVYKIPEK